MPAKYTLIILVLFIPPAIFSQDDTTYLPVTLKSNMDGDKIIAVEIGKKAIIFIPLQPVLEEAKANLQNEFIRKNNNDIIRFLNSASRNSDTIFIDNHYRLRRFEYLVSHQLEAGNAKVYYKREHAFVDTISHRLERYGGNADRFFYLPDRRPFFAVQEYSGILDSEDDLGQGHYTAYVNEGEKLASLRKE